MLGVLLALLVTIGLVGWTRPLVEKAGGVTDQAANIGLAGLISYGLFGTAVFFVGLVNTGRLVTLAAIVSLVGFGYWFLYRKQFKLHISLPKGLDLLFPLVIGLGLLMALAGVLAPSTMNDWDSIAYHLAVPKLWLADGKIHPIPYIHQSNFPFAVDSLFLVGLKWGGQAGAKAFVWIITILGSITIFGLARQRYGQRAGWWSSLVFTTAPIVLWLSGTAYIDVAHGLYAGLGLIFACQWLESNENKDAWISAILLSLAAGTKYTGLQTIAVAGLVCLIGAILLKRNLKPVLIIGLVSFGLASPWYIKNVIWKENPVFPFFYSKLGGKDWDQRRADIYTDEQNSFGVGREVPGEGSVQPQRLGHSVLGLAYQPGRYVNPFQKVGGGDPVGAVGIGIIGALLLGMFAGQREKFEKALIGSVLLSLLIWFVLTQQSRYIVALAVPLSLLAGQLTTKKGFAPLMSGLTVVQALASLYLLYSNRFEGQMQVITGKVTPEEYQTAGISFYGPAQEINKLGKDVKVALYDEVFGYLLDVPYFWANPGHSTIIPYDSMKDGADYAVEMRKLGFTHAYVNLSQLVKDPKDAQMLIDEMRGTPMPPDLKARMFDNWQTKYSVLVSDAVAKGEMQVIGQFGNPERPRGLILSFVKK